MARDGNRGLVVLFEYISHSIQHGIEITAHTALVSSKSDVTWHDQGNSTCCLILLHTNAHTSKTLTQLSFLIVHVRANTTARHTADSSTLKCSLFTFFLVVASRVTNSRTSNRQTLAVHAERAPSAPAFFRPAEYPEAILANRPMVDRLRGARFSGVDFVPLAQHAFL